MESLYHVSGYHSDCPKTPDTWCIYRKNKIDGKETFVEIRRAIFPVYTGLTKPEMLIKCLHGKTQNANESFNGIVWERIPKIHYVALGKLEFGMYDAIANFNYGKRACIDIFEGLKLSPRTYMKKMFQFK